MTAYERLSGRSLAVERVMAWHVLTVLGDALWRVDDLAIRVEALDLG